MKKSILTVIIVSVILMVMVAGINTLFTKKQYAEPYSLSSCNAGVTTIIR